MSIIKLFFVFVLSSTPILLKADTLSQEVTVEAVTRAAQKVDSVAHAPAPKPQHSLKPDLKSHRDSTLRTLLATLSKEDSLNAISRHETVPDDGIPGRMGSGKGMLKILRQLTVISQQRPWLPKASGVAGLLIILWFIMARIAGKKEEKRFMTTTRLSLMDGEVRRACLHIEKHFAEPGLTPETLCTDLITGEPFLEAIFQRELGMSIAGYIGQVRIHHAKRIVAKNPSLDGLSVASQTGFSDAVSFGVMFKKMAGIEFEKFREEKQTSPA
jgi:AraC-like DNA-binding protein